MNLIHQHGIFQIWGNTYYKDRATVKAYLVTGDNPENDQMVKLVTSKFYELQLAKAFPFNKWFNIGVYGRTAKHPLTKAKAIEVSAEFNMPADDVLVWLQANTLDIPLETETLELGKEGWSVGPCLTRQTGDGANWHSQLPGLYVRVRFNKMSIPFYVSDDKKVWDEVQTKAALQKHRATKVAESSIMTFLTSNKDEIMKRVGDRPFNKSGIAEYEPPYVSFFKKVNTKWKLIFHQGAANKVDQSKLADPNCKPIVTLKYNKQYGDNAYKDVIIAAYDDKLYVVDNWKSDAEHWRGWTSDDVSFTDAALKPLDPEDQYVYERALRALASKL